MTKIICLPTIKQQFVFFSFFFSSSSVFSETRHLNYQIIIKEPFSSKIKSVTWQTSRQSCHKIILQFFLIISLFFTKFVLKFSLGCYTDINIKKNTTKQTKAWFWKSMNIFVENKISYFFLNIRKVSYWQWIMITLQKKNTKKSSKFHRRINQKGKPFNIRFVPDYITCSTGWFIRNEWYFINFFCE